MPRICNVLVVEDHDGVRALLGDALDKEGFRLELAATGSEMRAALGRRKFDVVIVDVAVRDEDGFALAAHAAEQGCGVVLTSGDHRSFDSIQNSGHRFVLKPFMIAALLGVVDEVLREVEARCVKRKKLRQ
jgi:DNA-binding response OmpR family regulator